MIIGFIKGQQFSKKQPVIVSNSINYLEARFVFQTSDWSELVKFAHFKSGDAVYDFLLDGDTIPKEAQFNLYAGNWEVYIHGDRYVVDDDGNEKIVERITTNTQTVQVVKYEQSGSVLPEVGTSVAEQIAAVADNAKKIATSVRNEADAGAFDGKDGYTPVKGVDYFDGEPGKDGYTPVKGKDYFDGKDGSPGKDGVSVTHKWEGTVLKVTSASGTFSADLKGEKGDKGDRGDTGATGAKGDKGDPGADGANGKDGKDCSIAMDVVDYWTQTGVAFPTNGSYVPLEFTTSHIDIPNFVDASGKFILDVSNYFDVTYGSHFYHTGVKQHNGTKYIGNGAIIGIDGDNIGNDEVAPYCICDIGGNAVRVHKSTDEVETVDFRVSYVTYERIETIPNKYLKDEVVVIPSNTKAKIGQVLRVKSTGDFSFPTEWETADMPEEGLDGVSPSVTVTPITGGNRVEITDSEGVKSFNVMDGKDGKDGTVGGGEGVTVSNTATPGQMLLVKAVDENGKPTEWETVDRTHYKGKAVLESFVPEATVTVSEGMGFGIDISSAKVGETYIVNWDATEHECVCKLAAYNGMTVIAIGNVALFGGAENTGEPFVLGYIPALGMSGAFSITDGSHAVSAKKKTIPVTTLPNEYVSGLVLEKSIGTVNVVAETTFEGDRYDFIAPDFSLIEGEKYTVVFDETAYECTAYKLAIDASNVYVMLGNSSLLYNLGNSSSEPFLISYLLRTSELAFAAETSASHTLSVNRTTEVYERLPKECMPEEYTMETPFFDLVAMGLPEIKVGEEVELRADDAEPLQALRLALMRGQVKVRFMFNPTGDYPRSVTTVVSGVCGDGMQTHFSTMIRCWGWDIGLHAVTVGVGDVQIWAKAYSLAT